ncbi:MAG: transketolase-like TK C-terminal-containing protein, partial [Acidimicrobiia bacterium]
GVGEDGPTHQPIEQTMSLRAIPGLNVVRPGDANESVGAWQAALAADGPTALVFSRQGMPVQATTSAAEVAKGAYVLNDVSAPDAIIIGTGSELAVAVEAAALLDADVCVVSMPCWELFEAQDSRYRQSVLPTGVPAVSVEAGVTLGWHKYADDVVGIDRFGASAPASTVMTELGITAQAVAAKVQALL